LHTEKNAKNFKLLLKIRKNKKRHARILTTLSSRKETDRESPEYSALYARILVVYSKCSSVLSSSFGSILFLQKNRDSERKKDKTQFGSVCFSRKFKNQKEKKYHSTQIMEICVLVRG